MYTLQIRKHDMKMLVHLCSGNDIPVLKIGPKHWAIHMPYRDSYFLKTRAGLQI